MSKGPAPKNSPEPQQPTRQTVLTTDWHSFIMGAIVATLLIAGLAMTVIAMVFR